MKYVSCRPGFRGVDGTPVDNAAWFGEPRATSNEIVQVHGYNCQADNVMDAYRANAEMAREQQIKTAPVGYLWPGLYGTVEKIAFHAAQRQADVSAAKLADYLKTPSVDVLTHSLGARVALEAIVGHGAMVRNLFLTGPAVDNRCFLTEYAEAPTFVSGKILVFWSRNDPVLREAFFLDQMAVALGHSGPMAPVNNMESIDCSGTVLRHGDYRFDRAIWAKIAAVQA